MAIIKPTLEGKNYPMWKILMNFLTVALDKQLDPDRDPGFRAAAINSAWTSIESFTRNCLHEKIYTSFETLTLPAKYQVRVSFCDKLRYLYKGKAFKERDLFDKKYIIRDSLVKQADSWYPILQVANEIGYPIEKKIKSWEFLQNLYRLRNGLTHGQSIKILKSNFEEIEDEVSREYIKSVRYLNGKKVISLDKIIDKQNIGDFLNMDLTDFVINKTADAFDELGDIFGTTYEFTQWKEMRIDRK